MQSPLAQKPFVERLRQAIPAEQFRDIEWMLGMARLFLAVASLFSFWFNPTEPARYAPLAYILLVAYVAWALLVAAIVHARPTVPQAFALLVHLVDIFWPATISMFTAGPGSPFFIFSTFALLAAAYRWGMLETLATAAAGVVLYFAQALFIEPGPGYLRFALGGPHVDMNRFLMLGLFLAVMGYLFGYISEKEIQLRVEGLWTGTLISKVQGEFGLRGALRVMLRELAGLFGSGTLLLVLREASTGQTILWEARVPDQEGDLTMNSFPLDSAGQSTYLFPPPGHVWYLRRRHARREEAFDLRARDERGGRVRTGAWSVPAAFVAALPFRSLLGISISYGHEWSGHLLLLDPDLGSERALGLNFLRILSQRVGPAIYGVFLLRRLRSRAGAMERARVARELHDGVIQSVIGLEMEVDVLRRKAGPESAPLAADLARIQTLLRQEALNLRELMQQIKPLDVGPREFLDFLAYTVDKFGRDTGIKANFATSLEEVRLPSRVCRELGRIVQEALVNIRKHSGAHNVLVRFDSFDGVWKLLVDDDGRGFDFTGRLDQPALDAAHKGPLVIKERVRSIGGRMEIESVPGQGSKLEIFLPQKLYAEG